MTKFIKSFMADESGAVASEYAILLVLIAAILVTAVLLLSVAITGAMNRVTEIINTGGVPAAAGG
jgi:pilus assembly protein Flp/PilA